jgi:putative hydrolase of the HAD superfamily
VSERARLDDERDRAIIFDMDDTLYPERRFVLSGFAAVAHALRTTRGIDARESFRVLSGAMRAGRRRTALQTLCSRFGLPLDLVGELVGIIRQHRPRLRLGTSTRRVLAELRPRWRLGILTNGMPAVQARKVEALGLGPLVDEVVYASEHGTGSGKPERAPFLAMASRLRVVPERCVFVGDDPERDIAGAAGAGMRSVRIDGARSTIGCVHPVMPDSTIRHLSELPEMATTLLERKAHACLSR